MVAGSGNEEVEQEEEQDESSLLGTTHQASIHIIPWKCVALCVSCIADRHLLFHYIIQEVRSDI